MRLPSCPSCDAFVPPTATVCPHCALTHRPSNKPRGPLRGLMAIGAGGLLSMTLSACYGAPVDGPYEYDSAPPVVDAGGDSGADSSVPPTLDSGLNDAGDDAGADDGGADDGGADDGGADDGGADDGGADDGGADDGGADDGGADDGGADDGGA